MTINTKIERPGIKSSANKVSGNTKEHEIVSDENSFTLPDYGTAQVVIKAEDQLEAKYPTDVQTISRRQSSEDAQCFDKNKSAASL